MIIKKLIGIVGHAGVGKDTAAEFLNEHYTDVWAEAFARPLKSAAAELFGLPDEFFHDQDLKNQVVAYWNKTPREIAQYLATEVVRATLGEDFWIKRLNQKLCNQDISDSAAFYTGDDTVIVTDVRFQNELDWIYSQGGYILRVIRPGFSGNVGIPGHASEAGVVFDEVYKEMTYTILNNTDLDAYYLNLRRFANWCGLAVKDVPKEPPHGISLNTL